MENTPTYKLVREALAPTEEILRQAFEKGLLDQYEQFVTVLKADDYDAQVHFGYPNSRKLPRRDQYSQQLKRYHYCQAHTTVDDSRKTRRGLHDPDYRQIDRAKSIAKLKKDAVTMARDSVEGYCIKLSKKITETSGGASTLSVNYDGSTSPWSISHINVETSAGAQRWRTQMILNRSVLGIPFNQWPTRLVKG